jgi:D-glycero-alpha-D-manno-heptose 1-phosphate guanylyltransferase
MITEAIVLAGGLGTRLKSVVADLPKSLAPVNGRPFLAFLLDFAEKQGIEKFIFALGYKAELIEAFIQEYLPQKNYGFSIEAQPLGTGGAIFKACEAVSTKDVMVLNADTFFGVSFSNLAIIHELQQAECTLALKPMRAFDRYGVVEIEKQIVTGFSEKKYHDYGLINGGVYALDANAFLQKKFPSVFSFEKDYLEKWYKGGRILGITSDAYFIDIGIPEDYQRVQAELVKSLTVDR